MAAHDPVRAQAFASTWARPSQVITRLVGHDVLVVQGAPVSDEVLDASPTLRLVCCARGGPVNVDVQAATERGIPVVTTPGKNADAVADLTLGLMITLARRLPDAIRFIDSGAEFGHDNYEGAKWFGHDLAGHTLGLIGYGQVGHRVAQRALAFGLRLLVYDPYVAPEAIRTADIEPCDLAELLAGSDFISLHARLTPDSRDLLGAAEFAAMRPGAYLINTARHELVDEAALEVAMAAGRLGGLALDVATPSPAVGRHPLLAYPNVGDPAPSGGIDRRDAASRRRDGGGRHRALLGRPADAQRRQPGRPGRPDRTGGRAVSHVLAIDLGTGSCRAVVFDEAGQQVGIGQREWSHAALPGVPGSQVFDTARNWRLICECIREAISRAGLAASDIVGVSSTSMREGMVLYDAAGREIWACPNVDSPLGEPGRRSSSRPVTPGASSRRAATGSRSPRRRGSCGSASTSRRSSTPIAHVGMLGDWVLYRLSGEFVTDPSLRLELRTCSTCGAAAGRRSRWPSSAWRREVVPPVLEPGTVVGPVTATAAEETGLAAGTPVVVGGADTQLGLVGIGTVTARFGDPRRRQLLAAHRRHGPAAHRPATRGSARCATPCRASG